MVCKVFIDGEAGTTGLQIRNRLLERDDIELISIYDDDRKELRARLTAIKKADVSILCLPDEAALEIATLAASYNCRMIDASTAHRVHPDWTFGFPELNECTRKAIQFSNQVSNPGCYAVGAIALLHPLTSSGVICPDSPISINAVSGYTGGGRDLINEFVSGKTTGTFFYGMEQTHKHVPEIMKYGGLRRRPTFLPSVGHFAQGMIVQIPLPFVDSAQYGQIQQALKSHYDKSKFVDVTDCASNSDKIDPRMLNETNQLLLSIHVNLQHKCIVLTAVLDNLGKGASGAAVQNLNIMLGVDETAYL